MEDAPAPDRLLRDAQRIAEPPPVVPAKGLRGRRRVIVALAAIAAIAGAVLVLSRPLPFEQADQRPLPKKVAMVRGVVENPQNEPTGILPGRYALNFEWVYPSGKVQRLSDLRGKVVVLNWWATWCEPCREEMPTLERVARSEPQVVFLEVDLYEHEDDVAKFFERFGLLHLLPVIDFNGVAARRYAGGAGIPQTYFLDVKGVIRFVELGGPMPEETIRQGIARARGQ